MAVLIMSLLPPCVYGSKPNVINFSRDAYRAANNNWSIGRDSLDMVYFGNDNGLLEFDGIHWRLYPHSHVVRAVAVTPSGEIYTGGYEEFGVWERGVSGRLAYRSLSSGVDYEAIRNNEIWQVIADGGDVYFQSFSKVFRLRNGGIAEIVPEGGLMFLMKTDYGLLAQNINGPLMKLSGDGFETVPGSDFLSDTEVQFILPYREGEYLIGTSSIGLYIYDGSGFARLKGDFTDRAVRYRLNRGIRMGNGNFLFGTILDGIYEVDGRGHVVNHFSTENFLQNNTILSLMEDAHGNVWAATDRGISYIAYFPGMDFHIDPKGSVGAVYTAAVFAGRIFLGTNQGLYHMPVGKLSESNSLSRLSILDGTQGQVWDLQVWDGRLLCAHNSGLLVIDRQLRLSAVPSIQNGVNDICITSHKGHDYILLGTYSSLAALDAGLNPISGLYDIHEPISRIYVDATDDVWLSHAGEKGVYRFRFDEDGHSIRYRASYGRESDGELPESLRLFGIGGRAVFYGGDTFYMYDYLNNRLAPYQEMNEYLGGVKPIRQIVGISDSRYLALSDKAAYTFVTEDRSVRIIDRSPVEMTNISMVNRDENAVPLGDSVCIICLDNGILIKDMRLPGGAPSISQPYLRSVSTVARDQSRQYLPLQKTKPKIGYRNNTVVFDFAVFGALAQNLSFQYRLEHLEDKWSKPQRVNEARLVRLPKGDYTFLLRAADGMGNYSEITSFPFAVLPPWYQSAWAVLAYVAVFAGTAFLVWLLVLRRYRNAHLLKIRMREESRLKNQNHYLQAELRQKDAELFSQTSFIMQKNELIQQIKHELDELYTQYKANALLRQAFMRINTMLDRNLNADGDWKTFLMQFERTNSGFFKRLKELSPDLTPGDLKIAACLKLNLTSKDIAALMNISIRAVENSRHRLRKKLDIPPSVNLNDFFIDL